MARGTQTQITYTYNVGTKLTVSSKGKFGEWHARHVLVRVFSAAEREIPVSPHRTHEMSVCANFLSTQT